jgi:heme exporter protein A
LSALLRFEDVTLRRGGRLLFEGLDLELGPGEALQVTGPNGSGKSSLIRLAAGLLQPRRGRVHRSDLALADDHLALDRELPLVRALAFWRGSHARAALDIRGGSLTKAMAGLRLANLSQVPVRLLSSGQLKRATLARVVASNARLWLLDEPLNGLDSEGIELLSDFIDVHLHALGGAVLAASHQPLPGEWRQLELTP